MTDEERRTLAERIRHFRKRKEWSKYRLAEEAGISRAYLGGLERGDSSPTVEMLERIADALEVPVSDLTGETERFFGFGDAVGAIEAAHGRLPEEVRQAVFRQVQFRGTRLSTREDWRMAYLDVLEELLEEPSDEV